tara:strand:- start:2257 stop:3636 length:1380 start_codon:yes stop_codon:yes gene_type:complete
MNDFDFSAYDFEDNTPVKSKKTSSSEKTNKSTDFDFDAYEAPEPNKEKSYFDHIKDYGKTILKGSAEGLSRLGGIMGPTQDIHGKPYSEIMEDQSKSLDEVFPTEDPSYIQSSIRRGLKEAPTVLAMPGSTLGTGARALAAGFAGQGAEELGLPEWAQTAAELTAYIGPDITRKLLQKGNNADIIREAKKLGLTDEQITPLIQSEFKQKWLSKLAPKRGSTQKALEKTKAGLGEAHEKLKNSSLAKKEITEIENGKLINSLKEKMDDIPSVVRDKIQKDYDELLNNGITGKSIMNFWKDINAQFSSDKKHLGILKEPLKKALKSISPELGKDFDTINALHSKYYGIAAKLKPSIASDIVSGGEALGFLGAVVTGNVGFFGAIMTEQAAKKLAQQMLINPRFQQLSKKTVEAMNQNKFSLAKKTSDLIAREVSKIDKSAGKKLESLDDEDFKDLIMNSKK